MIDTDRLPLVHVTVDGKEMDVPAGLTILQSLKQAGIHIPSLCNDIRLERSNGNCGLCVVEVGTERRSTKACITPIAEGMVITTHSASLDSYRKLRLEQLLTDHNADCEPPCQQTCPAHIDIQRSLANVDYGNFEAAIRVIKDSNPFPSVCGRVCPHPCEAQCRRNLVEAPVAINAVKRFAADWDMSRDEPWHPAVKPPTGKRVAVIGAGPSGLAAAYYLAQAGHDITVFEKQSKPGGMMRYGIPEYRLPKATLDREIGTITALGVHIKTGRTLGVHLHLEDLHREYDAVYLAFGSWQASPLAIDGDTLPGVMLGIDFLENVIKGARLDLGDEVAVVGGGNTAIDCVRTAVRKGAKHVSLIYRRTQAEMPAAPEEVRDAIAEGVEMVFLTAPSHIELDESGRKQLVCLKMRLGEPDRSGRRRPIPIEGSEFRIPADTVIGAIGQSTNTQWVYNDLPITLAKWGDVQIDGATMQTSIEGIFAGGDCVTGPATVIQAVAAGGRAAAAIDEYLATGSVTPSREQYDCSRGTLEDLPRHEFEPIPKVARAEMPELEAKSRKGDFNEVALGLDEATARQEASRCLRCGCRARSYCELRHEATAHGIGYEPPLHSRPRLTVDRTHPFIIRDHNKCISCGKCIAACSEIEGVGVLAYQFAHGHMTVSTWNGEALAETDCVSCGQCVTACPCGALEYLRERPGVFRAIHDPSKLVVGFVAPAPRSVIADKFGVPFSEASGFLAGLMHQIGFDKAFDFSFSADLTIMEEATEFLNRLDTGGVMPQFTSCCPGWVNFVERRYPELIPHLSTCKSPQQMMGATVKNHFAKLYNVSLDDLYVVSIVPCLAKKYEACRPEMNTDGYPDVDAVITTSEFLEMLDMARIDPRTVEPGEFDEPYSRVSGAGVIFGASGGVAEAALRMAVEKLTGEPLTEHLDFTDLRGFEGFKQTTVEAPGRDIRVAVISGLGNAEPLIKRVVAGEDVGYDLVEIMACPGGCISGAGNPAPERVDELAERQKVLVNIDQTSTYRKSQENPDILRLYDKFYGEPNSELSHKLLHTSYRPFDRAAAHEVAMRARSDATAIDATR
ncbi:MAG: [FeFe] hydrogenase, group A [Bifidobacteriaceae bacterium]|jgi:formate dehydrogenase major subunit|nr:[FeFe] hydrogenase, group A [Bifidobacteriaceae bacterium]